MSNFSKHHSEAPRSAGLLLPAANQIELHPWSQDADQRFRDELFPDADVLEKPFRVEELLRRVRSKLGQRVE